MWYNYEVIYIYVYIYSIYEVKSDGITCFIWRDIMVYSQVLLNEKPKISPYCLRDNLLMEIEELINERNRCILITGQEFMGKTVLLEQFIDRYPDSSIQYFVKDDPYRDIVEFVIKDLCEQMLILLGENPIDFYEIPMQQAVMYFKKYYVKLCKKVEKERKKYFLIIDGLDKLSEEVYEMLLSYIPMGDKNGFYIIFSLESSSTRMLDRDYREVKVGRFSINDTKSLFKDYKEYEEKIIRIHEFCHGIPGYVDEFLRSIKANPDLIKEENLDRYVDFKSRMDQLWNEMNLDEESKVVTALVTYAPETLNVHQMQEILQTFALQECFSKISLLKIEDGEKIILPAIYKKRLNELLQEYKPKVRDLLTQYYTKNNKDIKSISYLTDLVIEEGDYNKLKSLVSTKVLTPYLNNITGTELIRDNLNILEKVSLDNKDWDFYLNSIFSKILINEVVQSPSSIDIEIQTLLSIKQHQEAINLAMLCTLIEDKCLFLSMVCKKLKKDEIDVPQFLLKEIRDNLYSSSNIKEFNKEIIDKWISISANIFPIDTELSMDIVREIVKYSDIGGSKEKLMDYLLLKLFLSVEDKSSNEVDLEVGSIEQIVNHIENEEYKNFLYITTSSQELTFAEVLDKAAQINDISAKVFYFNSWMSSNKGNPDILKVSRYLLENYKDNMEFTLTFRDLAIMLESIRTIELTKEVEEVLENIERMEIGITKNPEKEYIKYKLNLINAIFNIDRERSIYNFKEVFNYINTELKLIDIKAYAYAILYRYVSEKLTDKDEFSIKIKEKIRETFEIVFIETALESDILEEAIAELGLIDIEIAFELSDRMNTDVIRVKVMLKIVSRLIEQNQFTLNLVEKISERLTNQGHMDYILQRITLDLNRNSTVLNNDDKTVLFGLVRNIYSTSIKALSLSNLLYLLKDEREPYKFLVDELINLINVMDSIPHQKKIRHIILSNISEISESDGVLTYEKTLTDKTSILFNDDRLRRVDFYINSLLIKMLPDLLNLDNSNFYISKIVNSINSSDSLYNKVILYNLLGIKLINGQRLDLIEMFKENYLSVFQNPPHETTMFLDLFENAGVLLYILDKRLYLEILNSLTYTDYKDDAIISLIKFKMSSRSELEKIDLENLNKTINENVVFEIIELINLLGTDTKIYGSIKFLVNLVDKSVNRNDFTIRQGAIKEIYEKLHNIIESKLPQNNNIRHVGYKIVSYSSLASLRKCNIKRVVKDVLPDFNNLYKEIETIDNISDKIFVLCMLAVDSLSVDYILSNKCIKDAELLLNQLTNYTDKINRAQTVIETYYEIGDKQAAEHLLNNIFDVIKFHKDSYNFEENVSDLIEIAHKINPELASQLAKGIDSPNHQMEIKKTLKTLDLHFNPNRLSEEIKISNDTLKNFYSKTIQSFHSGRGISLTEDVFIGAHQKVVNTDIETTLYLIDLYIENTIKKNGGAKVSNLSEIFVYLLDNKEFNFSLDSSLINSEKVILNLQDFNQVNDEGNSGVYKKGSGEEAKRQIVSWINENSEEVLFIYDPYFSEEDLGMFTSIKSIENIYIITSYNNEKSQPTREEFIKNYNSYWKSICDQAIPKIEFIMLCSNKRKNPMHDRFIIADNIGLKYGVSFNGMNSNDFTIEELSAIEAEDRKNSIILPSIYTPPKTHGDYQITTVKFQL